MTTEDEESAVEPSGNRNPELTVSDDLNRPPRSLHTSEAALTLSEAKNVTSRRGATVVLPIGEIGTGKTTLLVELWTSFLTSGSIGSHRIAGSRTAMALEERAYHSRIESHCEAEFPDIDAETDRSQEANDGFLHMRIQRPDCRLVETLFADFSGERFKRIRQGAKVRAELPWINRADRALLVLDGRMYSTPGMQEIVLNRVRRQIYGLLECSMTFPQRSVAIVVSKGDLLTSEHRASLFEHLDALKRDLTPIDTEVVSIITAARPFDMTHPQGLDELVTWICSDRPTAEMPEVSSPIPTREIGRVVA